MSISLDLRELANKLEKNSDELLVNASRKNPEVFEKVATAVAAASTLLEDVAEDMDANADHSMTEQQWDDAVATIKAFRETGDDFLKKHASVMEEILLSIGAQKNAAKGNRKATEDEINRLRAERRRARMEEAYVKPKESLHDMWNSQAQAKAVEDQVKRYVPLEAPLQTRYPPDRPGGQMTRITDHVYQDITTGIIYDYKEGYTTQKGNKVPGGSVENQTRQLGDYRNQGTSLFETRESLMGRYAADDPQHLKKIATAIKTVRDSAPEMMNDALDRAYDAGCSTDVVASIIADQTKTGANLKDSLIAAGWSDMIGDASRDSKIALALNAIQELAPHLLKSAIDHAKKDGLTDQQIKSIIAGAFISNFNSSLGKEGEIKAAEILVPQLKALGWNNLITDHFNVLSKMGVTKSELRKVANAKPTSRVKKKSSLNQLQLTLRGFDRSIQDWSKCYRPSTEDNLRALLKEAAVSDDEEFRNRVISQYKAGEIDREVLDETLDDLDLAPYTEEEQPQEPMQTEVGQEVQELQQEGFGATPTTGLLGGMFGEEFGAPPTAGLLGEMFGEEFSRQPQIITPHTDLAGWEKIMVESKQTISGNLDVKRKMVEILHSRGRDAAHEYIKDLVNKEMRKRNAVGAFEKDENDDHWFIVAKELERLGYPTPQTSSDLGPSLPPENLEDEIEDKVKPPKSKKERDKNGERATNKDRIFDWERYQDVNDMHLSNKEALEYEQQAKMLFQDVVNAYEKVFSEYKFEGTKIPRSIEILPKWLKQYIKTLYVTKENTQAVIAALRKWLPGAVEEYEGDSLEEEYYEELLNRAAELRVEAKTLMEEGKKEEALNKKKEADKKKKEADTAKSSGSIRDKAIQSRVSKLTDLAEPILDQVADLQNARKALVEKNNITAANRVRKKAIGQARAAAINAVLEEDGLPLMYPGAADAKIINKVDFEKQLAELGKRYDTIEEDKARSRQTQRNKPIKGDVVNPPPEDSDGNPLITIVSDQDAYINKLLESFRLFPNEYYGDPEKNAKFPTKNVHKDIRAERAKWMEEQGFASPDYKLYGGSGTVYSMLAGLLSPIDGTENKLGILNYRVIDDQGNQRFELFSNPKKKIQDLLEEDEDGENYVVSIKVGDEDKEVKVGEDQLIEDNKGNILGIKLKTIFDNPEDYSKHYREGYDKFAKKENFSLPSVGRLNKLKQAVGLPVEKGARIDDMNDEYTQAWLEIHGPIPPELMNVPDEIQRAIKGLYEDQPDTEMTPEEKLEEAKTVMQGMKWNGDDLPHYPGFEGGVHPKYVDKMWAKMRSTGDSIRSKISGAFRRGKSVEEVQNSIKKSDPGAYIPDGILEFAQEFFTTQAENNSQVKDKWDNFSLSQGFYPLHYFAVGKASTRDLLKGHSPRFNSDKYVGEQGRLPQRPNKPTGRKR